MAWFGRKKGYDRARILADARKAAKRGRHEKAIGLYERVRKKEPDNPDVLRRLSTERALAGQMEEAWRDCRAAAASLSRRGFVDQAIGVYRDFASRVPKQVAVWQALSELELERKREPDAVKVLLQGRKQFRAKAERGEALLLVRRACEIDRTHFDAHFELADLMWRSGAGPRARQILDQLLPVARRGRNRRRLRARQLRMSPTPAAFGRWLVALFGG